MTSEAKSPAMRWAARAATMDETATLAELCDKCWGVITPPGTYMTPKIRRCRCGSLPWYTPEELVRTHGLEEILPLMFRTSERSRYERA